MSLNREFRVKNDINVLGRMLSAGVDLFDIFSDQTASFKVSAANDTFFVSGGDAFSILGDNGVVVAANALTETLVISGKDASYVEKGVAQFSSSNFTVTNGVVSIATPGIGNSNLTNNSINFGDGTSSGATALGGTFEIKGTPNQVTTTYNNLANDNVTISIPNDLIVPGNVYIQGGQTEVQNLSVLGNLLVAGSATFVNTSFTTTSALSVVNTGPGPALYVFQAAGLGDVAQFVDGDGGTVLHVGNAEPGGGGFIGVNTAFPNEALTVNGSISTNNIVYTLNWGDSRDWYSVFSTVASNSASWNIGGGANSYLNGLTGNWQDTWAYVLTQSASWDSTYANVYHQSAGWIGGHSAYTTVNSNSASWDSTYANVYHQSAGWIGGHSAYTTVNSNSANWSTAYHTVCTLSAEWSSVYTTFSANSALFAKLNTEVSFKNLTLTENSKSSLRKIFTGNFVGTDLFTVATFDKTAFYSAKFITQIKNTTNNYRAVLEIVATNNNGTWEGTVYGIVDQGSIFREVAVDSSGSTVDLVFTTNGIDNYVATILVDTISD